MLIFLPTSCVIHLLFSRTIGGVLGLLAILEHDRRRPGPDGILPGESIDGLYSFAHKLVILCHVSALAILC